MNPNRIHTDVEGLAGVDLRGESAQRDIATALMSRRGALGAMIAGVFTAVGCGKKPDRRDVHPEQQEQAFGLKKAYEHMEQSEVQWVTAAQLLQHEKRCVDGRECKCAACTPGGDIGDLAMELASTEAVTGKEFSETDILKIMERNLHHHQGAFYEHTDRHALSHFARDMRVSDQEMEELLKKPGKHEEKILAASTQPENIGCGHMKFLLQYAKDYPGMRSEIVEGLIRNFFRIRWNGNAQMEYVVLEGEHKEQAVMEVYIQGPVKPDTPLPLVQPHVAKDTIDSSMFMISKDAEKLSAEHFVGIAEEVVGIPGIDKKELLRLIAYNREAYLKSSAAKLTKGKSITVFQSFYDPQKRKLANVRVRPTA